MINLKRMFVLMTVIGFVLAFSSFVFAADSTVKININTASAGELTQLEGVGPKLAARIVAHREANGPFKAVEDIANVKGIGPKILADNKAIMTVGTPVVPAPAPASKP